MSESTLDVEANYDRDDLIGADNLVQKRDRTGRRWWSTITTSLGDGLWEVNKGWAKKMAVFKEIANPVPFHDMMRYRRYAERELDEYLGRCERDGVTPLDAEIVYVIIKTIHEQHERELEGARIQIINALKNDET